MNFMINKHKQNALPWYKRLFISNAPREEANDAKIIPCTNPNKAPIIKHKIAAIGKAKTATKKYITKKNR